MRKSFSSSYKLHRLEVYNWGTFHSNIWQMHPCGKHSLLTGDIGSGKSTLVDAITTLLVPHQKIIYNKAAGAEIKERSLSSYIRGEYKTEKDEYTQLAKAVALRDHTQYSVLLACFKANNDEYVTIAQVFWLKDNQNTPERFFVVAQSSLTITQDFSNFGNDLVKLKNRLKKQNDIEFFERFKDYSQCFRHLMGIQNEQALELFYQTVSLKSVGNLTNFVQTHMLERDDVESRIEELCNHFEDLNRSHHAIMRARQQIELLSELVVITDNYELDYNKLTNFKTAREQLNIFIANYHEQLLLERLESINKDYKKISRGIQQIQLEIDEKRKTYQQLQINLADNGGRRLSELTTNIKQRQQDLVGCQKHYETYLELAQKLKLEKIATENKFYQQHEVAKKLFVQLEEQFHVLQSRTVDVRIELKNLQEQEQECKDELLSLSKRKNNIPLRMLSLRDELANTLGIPINKLPFVGELLQVKSDEKEWEGAIERLLHSFGLSLLVPEEYASEVSRYVNKTHLKSKLVYYKVPDVLEKKETQIDDPDLVIHKIFIHPQSKFNRWLKQEIITKFDYICCNKISDFMRLNRAITSSGQIKTNKTRHEKDDRFDIHDRTRFILGWNNQEKIDLLRSNLDTISLRGQAIVKELGEVNKKQQQYSVDRDICRDFLQFTDFSYINTGFIIKQIEALEKEVLQIRNSSNILKTLEKQIIAILEVIKSKEQEERTALTQMGSLEMELKYHTEELASVRQLQETSTTSKDDAILITLFKSVTTTRKPNLKNINALQAEIRNLLKRDIDYLQNKTIQLTQEIIKKMNQYKNQFPSESKEIDVSIEAIAAYKIILIGLQQEDLPRHEERFKELLNEGTINSVALFQNQLDKSLREIHEKINLINQSLKNIEYNQGTYIELVTNRTNDLDIREFQQLLRACLSNTLTDSLYTEEKFLQIKSLIERFKGRENLADLDKRWTKKVTDVRNWVLFSAVERWNHDDQEKEFYSDSAGKSGGQKEKLAYTILASALAYQFGLSKLGQENNRSFRFVMIDEAFGKGSDESTHYALKLFSSLDLQLLIVTPLQKIHVIENYINSVHFVHNEGGRQSLVRHLSIEEYRQQQKQYA